MKIDFFEVPVEGVSLTFENVHWFPDDLTLLQFEEAALNLKRFDRKVLVNGYLSIVVQYECDRCLDKFDMPLEVDFKVDLELASDSDTQILDVDHHCLDSEMDRVVLKEAVIDVDHMLQQQVYLALPIKGLCSEQCKGVCMMCGANLNHSKCQCTKETDSPFSALAKLKK